MHGDGGVYPGWWSRAVYQENSRDQYMAAFASLLPVRCSICLTFACPLLHLRHFTLVSRVPRGVAECREKCRKERK